MHNIVQRPMAINGEVKIRPMMYLALSYDHRIVDGKEAVTFLVRIKELLEDPPFYKYRIQRLDHAVDLGARLRNVVACYIEEPQKPIATNPRIRGHASGCAELRVQRFQQGWRPVTLFALVTSVRSNVCQ